eukprot:TRINITY_DN1491_c0_g2_i1.p1 TRINITY_DN1491_c0_g2~~TRINITY_DN1491_c0_g2_i1.p1  ORF type:complete len:252 (+),score=39.78 TRINITY_DN1491_c0_g2_i1:468-1223(+)
MSLSQDPFYVVKEEVQQSVNGVTTLYQRWRELLETSNTANNDEFKWTSNELKSGIKSIEWDLQDLDDTIGIVESNRQKFKLEQQEVENRKKFISDTKTVIKRMKDDLQAASTRGKVEHDKRDSLLGAKKNPNNDRFRALDEAIANDHQEFINNQKQTQEQLFQDQDKDLDQLSNTVATLGQMGQAISSELSLQDRILTDLSNKVDNTSGRLGVVMRKLSKLIESASDRTQWCIIGVLALILIALIIVVFYV